MQIQHFEKSEERLRSETGKEYSFDYFFDQSTKERAERRERLGEEDEEEEEEETDSSDEDAEETLATGKQEPKASGASNKGASNEGGSELSNSQGGATERSPQHTHYVIEKFGDIGDD